MRPFLFPFCVLCVASHKRGEMKKDLFLFWFLVSEGLMDGPVVHTQGQNIVVMGKLMAEEPFHLVEGGKLRNQQQERGVEKKQISPKICP